MTVDIERPQCTCGQRQSEHPAIHIEYGDLSACVDSDIAGLVLSCWKRGIRTEESCQGFTYQENGDPATVFLAFERVEDYVAFAHAVLTDEDELTEFGNHAEGAFNQGEMAWDWGCHPAWSYSAADDYETGHLGMFCTLVFPRTDLREVERRMKT